MGHNSHRNIFIQEFLTEENIYWSTDFTPKADPYSLNYVTCKNSSCQKLDIVLLRFIYETSFSLISNSGLKHWYSSYDLCYIFILQPYYMLLQLGYTVLFMLLWQGYLQFMLTVVFHSISALTYFIGSLYPHIPIIYERKEAPPKWKLCNLYLHGWGVLLVFF